MHPQTTIDPAEDAEVWRPVVGYEGWYSVSSLGRVRRDMPARRTYAGRLCKQALYRGYPSVALTNGTHASLRRFAVHRLVAEAFLGPRPDGCGVNHLNGIKHDNRALNLEWCLPGDNSRHAADLGLLASGDRQGLRLHPESRQRGEAHHARLHPERLARGSRHGSAKLNEDAVRDILTSPLSTRALAATYDVSVSLIGQVRARTIWAHVDVD